MSRRTFLTSVVAGSALVLVARPVPAKAAPASGAVSFLAGMPTDPVLVVLEVLPDGSVYFALPRAEVGQGLTTSVAMLVAEELDIDADRVTVGLAPGRLELTTDQFTGNSNSIRSLWEPVRSIAATARARLVHAAAARWALDSSALTVEAGTVRSADGRSAHFGELAAAAADPALVVPAAEPKQPESYSVIGTARSRADARAIVTGRLEYALDLDVPNAMPVVVRRPPTLNGTVRTVDDAAIRAMPGVIDVAVVPSGVAIMARTFGQALVAKDAAQVTWNAGTVDDQSNESVLASLRAAAAFVPDSSPNAPGARKLDLEFDFAPVSHAPMETNSAVADVRSDGADIWSSTQSPVVARQVIAIALGLPPESVALHVVNAGGSFGRRLFFDGPLEAALVSKAMRKPVRLMWSRVDDMRHGRARPATYCRVGVEIDAGRVTGWTNRVAAVGTDFSHGLGDLTTSITIPSPLSSQSLFDDAGTPYVFAPKGSESLVEVPLLVPTGSWRSVFAGTARTASEIVVDRIADVLHRDPVEYRMASLDDEGYRAVLARLAEVSEWGRDVEPGCAQGVGFHAEYGSAAGFVVEIDTRGAAPRVTRATAVVDVGRAVNPRGVEAQMSGCLVDGISTVLRAGLHLDRGLPLEGSYSQFHYARQRDSPIDVEVVIMDPSGEPGGVGELGVPAAAAAVANAYARATGTTPTSFPILFDVDFEPFPR